MGGFSNTVGSGAGGILNNRVSSGLKEVMTENKKTLMSKVASWTPLIEKAKATYLTSSGSKMSEVKQVLLAQAYERAFLLASSKNQGLTREHIISATQNLKNVDNPAAYIFALLDAVIPNLTYADVVAVAPMVTPKSPIYFPQLTANDSRNGITKGDKLLGATNWNSNNFYTSNRYRNYSVDLTEAVGNSTISFTLEAPAFPIYENQVRVVYTQAGSTPKVYNFVDNGSGGFVNNPALADSGSIDYSDGKVTLNFGFSIATGDTLVMDFKYSLDATKPAQVLFEFATKELDAQPRRIRSVYKLDNFYLASQVLTSNFDLEQQMQRAVSGYINKEISGGVFDNLLDNVTGSFIFDDTIPAGVSWAMYRYGVLASIIQAKNNIRQNVQRGEGNILVCGTAMMNLLETMEDNIYKPIAGAEKTIGPYVAGELMGRFKVVKNQDFPDDTSVMVFKNSDVDASYVVGVNVPLYASDPLSLDTLEVVQGMGTLMAESQLFDNSIVEIVLT